MLRKILHGLQHVVQLFASTLARLLAVQLPMHLLSVRPDLKKFHK